MEKFDFGKRLKALRKSADVTQAELADSLNERRATLSNYENKNVYPGFNMLIKLADYFHVSVDYLTGRSDDYEVNSKETEDILYWFRIMDPTPYSNNEYGIYALTPNSNIDFYNLSDLKKKYNRIYLQLLQCAPDDKVHFKECYELLSKFGFLGSTKYIEENIYLSMFKKQWSGIYKIDDEFNIHKANLKTNLLISSPDILGYTEEYKKYMKDNSLCGYAENVHDVEYHAIEMRRIINTYSFSSNLFISNVNEKLRDINFYYDTNFKRKMTFTSLLSYMYYELLEDFFKGYYPHQCEKCKKYFLSRERHDPMLVYYCDDCKKRKEV